MTPFWRWRRRSDAITVPVAPLALDGEEPALFTFDGVVVERGDRTVLTIDRAVIPHVGSTAIVGPSGSGKSTLLRLCNRLEVPTTGTVRYFGAELAEVDATTLRRRVAMVFQQPVALEGTVADNLRSAVPLLAEPAVEAALARVGLPADLAERPAGDLSGGERQRLGLARSLLTDPAVVLLDEVTSALDPTSASRIERLVEGLIADGIHAVWVTHDLDQLRRVADHVLVVVAGQVVQSGPVRAVLDRPAPEVRSFLEGAQA